MLEIMDQHGHNKKYFFKLRISMHLKQNIGMMMILIMMEIITMILMIQIQQEIMKGGILLDLKMSLMVYIMEIDIGF